MCQLYGIRYHVVTLVAVFLALGLGLMLGGTLGEKIIVRQQIQLLQRLEDRYTQAKADNSKLHQETDALKEQTEQLEQVMAQVGDHYAKDRLIGKKIAILQLEQTDISPLLTTLEEAKAQVISTVQITNPNLWLEAGTTSEWPQKLGVRAMGDVRTERLLLAESLVQDLYGPAGNSVANGTEGKVVRYLQQYSAIDTSGTLQQKPDAVIVIGGTSAANQARLAALDLPLLQALKAHALPVVGVERSDVERSAVAAYRDLGVSTVDNMDQVTGLVALVDLLSGASGHFGTKETAEALLPQNTTAKEVSTQ